MDTMRRRFAVGAALLLLMASACAGARPPAEPSRGPVTLTFLGVAGWSISDGTRTLLIDPYFSRTGVRENAHVDEAAIRARVPPRADLILIGHDHWDHSVDARRVAELTGAPLLGGLGLVRRLRDQGFPSERLIGVRGGEDFEFGSYSVRVIPSLHSFTGLARGGDVDTFAFLIRLNGHELLVFDTANFIERELQGLRPDVVVVATPIREKVHRYTCRLLQTLGSPARVLPAHFDDFALPPETPLSQGNAADLTLFVDEVRSCSPGSTVTIPKPFVPVTL
jgi:L-ascorbate metabolism protein UlaG (beta-lactamase superfamily)